MSSIWRLPVGGRIDRNRRIVFRFDGRTLEGFAGDTVASALLAAGVRLVARSFRLHRPRGVLSCGVEEPNALVHVRLGSYEEPNVRATLMPLLPDLEIFSQNSWPVLRWDIGELFDLLPKLWSAGFYHKTFLWPSWHTYEPVIRRAAGIGRIRAPDAASGAFTQQDIETDVLVCGGGPAGMVAAAECARCGTSVTLLHADSEFGAVTAAALANKSATSVRIFRNTLALGVFGEKVVVALQELGWGAAGPHRCLLRIRARSIVIATGSIEQPLVFEHNDRPGIMLAGAVTKYLDDYAVRAGKTIVLVTNNDESYAALERWRDGGITVAAVVDSRARPGLAARSVVARLSVPHITDPRHLSVKGRLAVRRIEIRDDSGRLRQIACDLVAVSGGWIPNVHLYSQALGELRYEAGLHAYAPDSGAPGVYAVGGAAGLLDTNATHEHAISVGQAAAAYARDGDRRPVAWPARPALSFGPTRFAGRANRQWLDYQHDVTVADAASAVEQGYTHVEHFKRHTTTGMAVDQGKTSLRNALEQLAQQSRRPLEDLKPPTYRPPYVPLPLAAAAGPNVGRWYRPERRLPGHAEHVKLGAHFEDVGGWLRPLHYAGSSSVQDCIDSEVRAVRTAAGLFESSPLGKLEVSGPDALEFLDRMYVNNLRSLTPGRVRYALMLRDNGIVMDDGTVARTGSEEFLVTTTGGNADRVYLWMRDWAECEWPQLKVLITPVTTAWGTVTLSGPAAREVLERAGTDVDLAPDAFPHMTIRLGRVARLPARIYRVSFTGEISYEINVAADQTETLWSALRSAATHGEVRPYGIDALNLLRTEKGYLHIGADTDGTTTPLDLAWGPMIDRKPGDFVGRGALALPEYQRAARLQLVGVLAEDERDALRSGAHLMSYSGQRSEGYLTSAYFSPTLGRGVALARLEGGFKRIGEPLLAYDQGSTIAVRVAKPVFYDPENSRLHA